MKRKHRSPQRAPKKRDSKRRRYFYWKYRREHPEEFAKKTQRAAHLSETLGASKPMAGFLAATSEGPGIKYRIRYGYIDEDNLGSMANSKLTKSTTSYEKALNRYKAMGWLRTHDQKGRRFIVIEKSSDGGKTWPTRLFHDCQR
ncbi:MAG: hypothetical protein K6E59_04710 [Bacilli bacterium]|nr:hypothetical protein [Bacilli bacterium]